MNDFLFELLFLQHINSNSRTTQCFHVNSNMIFLIEIPSTLDESSPTLSFKQFLYQQFVLLAQSPLLKNKLPGTDLKSAQWKHDITNSVLEMAQYKNTTLKVHDKEEFYLCEKWHNSKECCYLVNQNGAIRFISKVELLFIRMETRFEKYELIFQVLYILFYFNCYIFTFSITKK
ncbi:hypothetical protein RFI_32794 [Reticulomyxa filosa]|uniref:Uncharacterized protein n=1 Tax=Reticulomyxa filosa TaxID=46433 RepID=X6LTZ3_RETFI|nr:hypothetical protein RFI_32794 [Reticulomyxa filosa]|eukprot:ETO04602.1 hypothetical protein RFI_32794 [Reticulomyxa filosa]